MNCSQLAPTHLIQGEHQAKEVDQDPEGVEDVMSVGTLVKVMLMLVWTLVMQVCTLEQQNPANHSEPGRGQDYLCLKERAT